MLNLRNHKLIKKLSVVTMLGIAAIGGIGIANNTNGVRVQTVQAARVRRLPIGQYNHYIRLSHRKGTHYFKPVHMRTWSPAGNVYHMNGKYWDTGSAFTIDRVIGTKTIGLRHFFIETQSGDKFLVPSSDFYLPTMYRIKSGEKIKTYDFTEDGEHTWVHLDTYGSGHGKFLVVNAKSTGGRIYHNGQAYRAIADHNNNEGYISEADFNKLQKVHGNLLTYTIF